VWYLLLVSRNNRVIEYSIVGDHSAIATEGDHSDEPQET
jgi:hypothetical protein